MTAISLIAVAVAAQASALIWTYLLAFGIGLDTEGRKKTPPRAVGVLSAFAGASAIAALALAFIAGGV